MERTEWIQFIIRLSFGRYAFSPEFFEGVRILREIEKWMQANHILLLPYFNEYGFPRFPSGAVTVSFLAREEAEKAMAFRVLVNELGLSSTLESVRLVNLPEARLTPPRSVPFFYITYTHRPANRATASHSATMAAAPVQLDGARARRSPAARRRSAMTSGGISRSASQMPAGSRTRSSSRPRTGMKSGIRSMGDRA